MICANNARIIYVANKRKIPNIVCYTVLYFRCSLRDLLSSANILLSETSSTLNKTCIVSLTKVPREFHDSRAVSISIVDKINCNCKGRITSDKSESDPRWKTEEIYRLLTKLPTAPAQPRQLSDRSISGL